jgi:Transposase DDE domain
VSDPNPTVADPQARSLFQSFVLDPALIFARVIDCEDIARAVAQEVGKTRDRIFTPIVTLSLFLSQLLSDDQTCLPAVARLLAWRTARGLPACSPDTGGYCKARQRLPETLLPRLVRETADGLQDNAPQSWLFHGRRVILADGSTVSMPDTPENQAEYPQHSNQKPGCGFPIARIVVLIFLATGSVLDAAIGPSKGKLTGEMALIRTLHSRLKPGDIMVGDSYYSSFDEVVTLSGMGVDVVMRQHGGRRSDFRRGTRLGHEDHLVQWQRSRNRPAWMSREEFAVLPRVMLMREIKVRVDKKGFRTKVFVVVTTLLDPEAFPRPELAGLYRARWHAELDIRSIKQTLKMDVLRCKTPAMVRKEIWGHLLVYNLIRGVMAEAASRHGVLPRELSLQGARQTVAGFRAELARADGELAVVMRAVALRAIASHRVGDRPDRVEPRVVKRRPKAYPRMHESRQSFKKRKRLIPAA